MEGAPYGRASGYNTYGRERPASGTCKRATRKRVPRPPRGARVIELTGGLDSFATWIRLEDGSVVDNPPLHEPGAGVEMMTS